MSRNKFSASNAIINVFKPPPGWALLRAGLLNAAELRELEPERRQPGSAGHRLMGNSEPAPPGPVGEMGPVRGPRGAARRRRQRPWPSARPGQAQARRARCGSRSLRGGGAEKPAEKSTPRHPVPSFRAGAPPFPQPAGTRLAPAAPPPQPRIAPQLAAAAAGTGGSG